MSGGGGAVTQNQNTTSTTQFPQFYNDYLFNNNGQWGGGLFNLMGNQMNQMPNIFNNLQQGGLAPLNQMLPPSNNMMPPHTNVLPPMNR
jgi:hypothetical protein